MNILKANILSSSPLLPVRVFLSLVYNLIVSVRNKLYDWQFLKTHRTDVRVISIGNLSVGGTGKTILTQSLARHLQAGGFRPAVLSRGYGRKTKGLHVVSDGTNITGTVRTSGDEPYLMAANLTGVPVVVSEDRVAGAKHIGKQFAVDVIILDDGFQHRRIHRDLDILLEDRSGNVRPHLLPWGDLREPLSSKKRADLVLTSKSSPQPEGEHEFLIRPAFELSDHLGNGVSFNRVKDGFGAFSGLGNNDHFFRVVEDTIGPLVLAVPLPDHCDYSDSDLARIPFAKCPFWVTTQKDFIKLEPELCALHNILYLSVEGVLPGALLKSLKLHFK